MGLFFSPILLFLYRVAHYRFQLFGRHTSCVAQINFVMETCVGYVNFLYAILPPEPLKRRNDIVKIAVNPIIALFAHLDCISYSSFEIRQTHSV